jgi:SWI/SNF-related matrix-associated actin-dependent regulator of chromatin subfamily A member 5
VQRVKGPFLVVVPLTVMFNWSSELRRFCPSLELLRCHTSDSQEATRLRKILSYEEGKLEVVLTTYEMLKSQHLSGPLRRITWRAVVLDEGHRIRNEETDLSKACFALKTVFRLVLTGTPLQNSLRETGVILRFLAPNIFTDLTFFESAFDLNQGKGNKIDRALLDKAHYMLRPFILRRLKSEVEQKLPPKLETLIECPMTELQKEISQFLLIKQHRVLALIDQRMQQTVPNSRETAKLAEHAEARSLMGLLAHLRKAANHPFLFSGIENVSIDGSATSEIISTSGKMVVLDKLLTKLIDKGHRVVLFSQFTRMLDVLCDYLDMKGYKYKRLDGQTNRVMREVNVTLFNKKDSDIPIFCLSTRAGGEGVNLFTADTVILFDR